MKKVSLLVIHGIGKPEPGYAKEFIQGVNKQFIKVLHSLAGENLDYSQGLQFKEIIWDDIVGESQGKLKTIFEQDFSLRKKKSFLGIFRRICLFGLIALLSFWIFKKPVLFSIILIGLVYYLPQAIYVLRTRFAAEFIDDIIAYQNKFAYDKIAQRISSALNSLEKDSQDGEVTFASHSLGTVIAFNYIYDLQKKSPNNFNKDFILTNFFTFGSPLALFSLEYGSELFKHPISLEHTSGRWVNIFDKDDPIAYPLKNLNQFYQDTILKDEEVNTGIFGISHVYYWKNKKLHRIIAKKLALDWLRINQKCSQEELNRLYANYDRTLG